MIAALFGHSCGDLAPTLQSMSPPMQDEWDYIVEEHFFTGS